jgi:hypothetical protein
MLAPVDNKTASKQRQSSLKTASKRKICIGLLFKYCWCMQKFDRAIQAWRDFTPFL